MLGFKTKQYLVSTSETTFYGYNLKPTYYGVSLGHIIILGWSNQIYSLVELLYLAQL